MIKTEIVYSQGPFYLNWLTSIPACISNYTHHKMGWNNLFILKLQLYNRWIFAYSSMRELKLIHVGKRSHRKPIAHVLNSISYLGSLSLTKYMRLWHGYINKNPTFSVGVVIHSCPNFNVGLNEPLLGLWDGCMVIYHNFIWLQLHSHNLN